MVLWNQQITPLRRIKQKLFLINTADNSDLAFQAFDNECT